MYVCMYVCMYEYTGVATKSQVCACVHTLCTHAHTHAHASTRTRTRARKHTHTQTHARAHANTRVRARSLSLTCAGVLAYLCMMHICVLYMCVYVCVYVCALCMCVRACVRVYTHVYTHALHTHRKHVNMQPTVSLFFFAFFAATIRVEVFGTIECVLFL